MRLKDREEMDRGKTESAMVRARMGNARRKDKAEGAVAWPDKTPPWEISLHSSTVHKIDEQMHFLGKCYLPALSIQA